MGKRKAFLTQNLKNLVMQNTEQRGGDGRGGRGFGRGGDRGGDRGRGGRGGRGGMGGGRPGQRGGKEEWNPATKLGRLVKSGKVTSFEEIFRYSVPIKEPQIVDTLVKKNNHTLKEEVMKVKPVQKQTKAGQRTRFKAWVLIGDENGHIGLGQRAHKEVQGAIKGATLDAKMNFTPVRKGYWGNKIGQPHTVPFKMTGSCGSVRVRLIPAPRGTAIVGAPVSKKVLQYAGINDCYTQSRGSTRTKGNFLYAIFRALRKSYGFLTPEFWGQPAFSKGLYETYQDDLKKL